MARRLGQYLTAILIVTVSCVSPSRAADFPVAIAASDDASLPAPVPRDQPLRADQVYEMTARALEQIGGMAGVVPDTAKLVLIKPNISIARPSGSGVITDARVVRAVALLVHEAAPGARILIGEGAGGWVSPALADCSNVHMGGGSRSELIQDGFAVAGHRETVRELRALGIDIDVHDLNFDPAYKLTVPGGGLLWDEYEIARTVIDADAWINVPVAKTHGSKITCCMKNHFGIFPGTIYGWNKARGTPDHGPIPHWPRTLDETWVDEVLVSRVDLNVVDMIQGTEGGAFQGDPKRMNLIVAGRDPIATDLVVAQLMGFNPDDFEFADLGAQRGIGPGSIDNVEVRGGDPLVLRSRFAKAGIDNDGDWGEHAVYGMGPRRWTLLGPLEPEHTFTAAQLQALSPVPGQAGWSPVVWFGFDKIDLDGYYDDPVSKVAYAFTHFTMAQSDSVRFWVGSDEGLTVWIDGEQIYRHEGRRRHLLGGDRIPGYVEAGEHRLLVRAEQGRGRFDFSFNICEPIDDVLYAGNRYPGVRYYQIGGGDRPLGDEQVQARQSWDPWRVGGIESTLTTDYDPVVGYPQAPDSLVLEVRPAASTALFEVIAAQFPAVAVWDAGDTVTPTVFSQLPFALGYMGMGKEWWAPEQRIELGRVLRWAGLSWWLSTSNGRAESSKAIAGWLARGRVPLAGHGDGWEQVGGYRKAAQAAEVLSVRPDTVVWHEYGDGSWGRLPGSDWLEMPVLVVEATSEPLGYPAWVDSAAAAALDLARRPWTDYEETWGRRGCPAGLAAWDAWVIEWERQPWTADWSREEEIRDRLGGIRSRGFYAEQARGKEQAAAMFRRAAAATAGRRQAALDTAAAAYARVAATLRDLQEGLPESRRGDIPAEDSLRQAQIAQLRTLPRQARGAERQALGALTHMLDGAPLPPPQEDPMLRRDQGRKLAHWQASLSKGVSDLTLAEGVLTRRHLRGRDAEGEEAEVLAAMPAQPGWEVAIEILSGRGLYQVAQQPAADNGWSTVIRIDDEWTDFDNATELVVWAVPVD